MNAYLISSKKFDLDCEKAVAEFESVNSQFLISYYENCDDFDYMSVYTEDAEDLREAFITAIQKILDALSDFTTNLIAEMSARIEAKKLNERLAEIKSVMAKERSELLNHNISIFDMAKYKKFYTDFIDRYTAEIKKMSAREFKSFEEYEEWRDKMQNDLADFNYKLTDEEQWKLSVSVNSAIHMTEDEAQNYKKNLKMAHAYGDKMISDMKSEYHKRDMGTSYVDLSDKDASLFSMKNSAIIGFCNQLSAVIKSILRTMAKHPFATLALIVVAIAL